MDQQQKPFKTIEVIDARTRQVCKVACMSCIRGHRTTSCGIPVCRTKVFWTVKRPGRPSNSCTCRYGATGGCKCVVARSSCPHKSKKGEKRSGECRCDENGRYCCLIEPDHWTALLSLEKPIITFYPSREALDAAQSNLMPADLPIRFPQTPSDSAMSPTSMSSIIGTPGPILHPRIAPMPSATLTDLPGIYAESAVSTPRLEHYPRFGMMGVGAPQGSQPGNPPDVLVWQGEAPLAPGSYDPLQQSTAGPSESVILDSEPVRSCCQPGPPTPMDTSSPMTDVTSTYISEQIPSAIEQIAKNTFDPMPLASPQPTFDFDKLQLDYLSHQLPNFICQNCGLSGCTCRHCPPIFQNFGTTSWAQCCGRKHAQDSAPAEEFKKVPRTERYDAEGGIRSRRAQHDSGTYMIPHTPNGQMAEGALDASADLVAASTADPSTFLYSTTFDLDHDFLLAHDQAGLDLNEFLLPDLGTVDGDDPGGGEARIGGGGSGGCCCGD